MGKGQTVSGPILKKKKKTSQEKGGGSEEEGEKRPCCKEQQMKPGKRPLEARSSCEKKRKKGEKH